MSVLENGIYLIFKCMYNIITVRTIQNSVSFANPEYSSIVDSTLKIRHTNTTMNLWAKIKQYVTLHD